MTLSHASSIRGRTVRQAGPCKTTAVARQKATHAPPRSNDFGMVLSSLTFDHQPERGLTADFKPNVRLA